MIQVVVLITFIFPTEAAVKKTFLMMELEKKLEFVDLPK